PIYRDGARFLCAAETGSPKNHRTSGRIRMEGRRIGKKGGKLRRGNRDNYSEGIFRIDRLITDGDHDRTGGGPLGNRGDHLTVQPTGHRSRDAVEANRAGPPAFSKTRS